MADIQESLLTSLLRPVQANLTPSQANLAVAERLKRIGKVNTEIADWLQV